MLNFIRRNAQSVFFQIIVVMIVLAFVFWGGSSMLNNHQAAITVNKEEVSFQEFEKTYNNLYAQIAARFGGSLPKALADTMYIKGQAVNQLVRDTLLKQGADEMGVVVSAYEIQRKIKSMPEFQEGGVFNIEQYEKVLASNGYSPAKFEDFMKHDLLAQKAAADIGSFAVSVTDFEVKSLYLLENESVSVDYVKISPSDLIGQAEPNDEELAAWFEKNKGQYKTEPQYKLSYLSFLYDDLGSKITIEPADIETYYQKHLEDYKIPESRHVRHILFRAGDSDSDELHRQKQATAEETLKKIQNGADFIELAQEVSEGPSAPDGGDLGFFVREQMVPEFADAAFSMSSGEVSGVVKTRFGYHILKLEEIKQAETTPLTELREGIENTLKMEQARPIAFQMANKAYEGIIGAGSLANFAEGNKDYQITKTDFFAKDQPPANLQGRQEFLDKAFALNKGELSSLIETANGYAIIFAEDVKPPEQLPLDQVKEQAAKDYAVEVSQTMAKETAAGIAAELAKGKGLEAALDGKPFKLASSGFFTKSRPDTTGFPASLVPQAFRLSKAKPYTEQPTLAGGDYFVFSLKERKEPVQEITDKVKKGYIEALKQLKRQQILSAWIKNQEDGSVVTVHKSLQQK